MKSRYCVAAVVGLLLAGVGPAAGQGASIQATATVVAPVEQPSVRVVASAASGRTLPSLIVEGERRWGVTVQVGAGEPVVYSEAWALRGLELRPHDPVRVVLAAL